MASGKTLELREFSQLAKAKQWLTAFDRERETRERDRSLRGKARIRARRVK